MHPGANVQIGTPHPTAARYVLCQCSRSEQNQPFRREAEPYNTKCTGKWVILLSDSGNCDEGTNFRFQRQSRIDRWGVPACKLSYPQGEDVVLITNSVRDGPGEINGYQRRSRISVVPDSWQ